MLNTKIHIDDPFVKLITRLIESYANIDEQKINGSTEGSFFINEQWIKAMALVYKRYVLLQAKTSSFLDSTQSSSKKARLMRLIGKSRVDSNFESKPEIPWFFKIHKNMGENDWKIMREDFGIHVNSPKRNSQTNLIPVPLRCWEEGNIPAKILDFLRSSLCISQPSPIQMQAIPIILSGRDLVARAETGSGKSISFILPILMRIAHDGKVELPRALLVAPTQELTRQLYGVATPLAEKIDIRCILTIGGESIQSNASDIRRGAGLIIGTPGRIWDLVEGGWLPFTEVKMITIDEADRCTDAGLIENVQKLIHHSQKQVDTSAQLLFFSATYGESMKFIKEVVRSDALFVQIEGSSRNIRQLVELVGDNPHETVTRLVHRYIRSYEAPIIIFCNSRESCEALLARLDAFDVAGTVLHAGLSSNERQRIFSDFREKKTPILITTDALARGIDIENISLVVNFDAPTGLEALARYIHRVGRTGRGGKSGVACTFVRKSDEEFVRTLRRYLTECDQPIPRDVDKICGKNASVGETLLIS
ncbi:RNA helicase [Perkinsela sp. CCAP 1560/4]|nr:RNA helicase [Perkinsela sp. CCAP 1560/4]|eukprot:KNH05563.1 RNA helicase [Perkinsela sp. CCAP 1560/4]